MLLSIDHSSTADTLVLAAYCTIGFFVIMIISCWSMRSGWVDDPARPANVIAREFWIGKLPVDRQHQAMKLELELTQLKPYLSRSSSASALTKKHELESQLEELCHPHFIGAGLRHRFENYLEAQMPELFTASGQLRRPGRLPKNAAALRDAFNAGAQASTLS